MCLYSCANTWYSKFCMHVMNMHMHWHSKCVCVCVQSSGLPGVGSWAKRWSSAHGSVPTGSWGSSGGRPGTPPAAGAAVPAQTGPPSPRSASPVPARASTASHQSSTGWGQTFLSSPLHWSTTGREKTATHRVRDLKEKKKNAAAHINTDREVPEGRNKAAQLPLSLVWAQ